MTTLGLWEYPIAPAATIPDFSKKPQLTLSMDELLRTERFLTRRDVDTARVSVSQAVAYDLAESSPNAVKAAQAVALLALSENLHLLQLSMLLFSCAEPSRR